MVLILVNPYFVSKIVLTKCEKKKSSDREKLLKFEAEGREFANSERSEQVLVTECFSNFSCRFLNPNHFYQFKFSFS